MTLHIINMQRAGCADQWEAQACEASVKISSFQVNHKLVSLKVEDRQKGMVRAALESIGLRPHSQQNGTLLVLQTDQIHIKGEETV